MRRGKTLILDCVAYCLAKSRCQNLELLYRFDLGLKASAIVDESLRAVVSGEDYPITLLGFAAAEDSGKKKDNRDAIHIIASPDFS